MENATLKAQESNLIEDCSSFTFEDVESGNYELVANHGSQTRFNITPGGLEADEEDGGVPYVPLVMVMVLLVIAAVFYRGVKE